MQITIDTAGMDPGAAFVYAKDCERLDGRLGRNGQGWYFETYNATELGLTDRDFDKLYGTGRTRTAAVKAVAKQLDIDPDTLVFVYEKI